MTILLFTIIVITMILLPVGLAIWLRRRFAVPWLLFCVGMLTFVGSQIYHIPLNSWLDDLGVIGSISADAPDLWRTAVILGLSAGISETLARVLLFYFLFRRQLADRFADGVMVGLGHGGIEAMIVGGVFTAGSLSSLLALRGVDLATLSLSSAQLTAVTEQLASIQNSPWLVGLSLVERLIALTLHVTISVLVWHAFKKRQVWPVLLAVAWHSFLDATVVYAPQFLDIVWVELILLGMVLPGAIWLWRQWPAPTKNWRGQSWNGFVGNGRCQRAAAAVANAAGAGYLCRVFALWPRFSHAG